MKFGDIVFVCAKLRRFRSYKSISYAKREWERVEFYEPRKAIYIGYRTLANGHMENPSGYGDEWVPTEYIRAALVVFNERQNPVYAFFEDLEKIEVAQRCTVHSMVTGKQCLNKAVNIEINAIFNKGLVKREEEK